MAVEILREKGYDQSVDFWALGVIFFELLTGTTPFDGDTPEEVFKNILNYKECMVAIYKEAGDGITPAAREFLDKTICEPEVRIGRKGLADFKSLDLFKCIDWDKMQQITPPFIPQVLIALHYVNIFSSQVRLTFHISIYHQRLHVTARPTMLSNKCMTSQTKM
jgi:serine/threonine protein kinase